MSTRIPPDSPVSSGTPALEGSDCVDAPGVAPADLSGRRAGLLRAHLALVAVDALVGGAVVHEAELALAGEGPGGVDAGAVLADARKQRALVDLPGQVRHGVLDYSLGHVRPAQGGPGQGALDRTGRAVAAPGLTEGAAADHPAERIFT